MPKLRGLKAPKSIESVSESFQVEMAIPQKPGKSEFLKGNVLEYDIDLVKQTEDDEHVDVFQILLQNSHGQVVQNEIVHDSVIFRLFNVDTPQGKDVVIRFIEPHPKNSSELMSHVRQLNAQVERYESAFAAVLTWMVEPKTGQCQELAVGVYRNDQGSYFYSASSFGDGGNVLYPGNGGGELPVQQMTLGLRPQASGLQLLSSGCDQN